MLEELYDAVAKVGLELHWGKTKIMNNILDEDRNCSSMKVKGHTVEIIGYEESAMYLGRSLSFGKLHDAELRHRINRGWAKFSMQKRELCSKKYPLQDRLKLFEATVTPTVLYASGTWTMNKSREAALRTAQRQMLRKIVGVRRLLVEVTGGSSSEGSGEDTDDAEECDESWVSWIKRATHTAEEAARLAKVKDWVHGQREAKWKLAGHIGRRSDERWSWKCLRWSPLSMRCAGRPYLRWADCLDAYEKDWLNKVKPRSSWYALSKNFCKLEKRFDRSSRRQA